MSSLLGYMPTRIWVKAGSVAERFVNRNYEQEATETLREVEEYRTSRDVIEEQKRQEAEDFFAALEDLFEESAVLAEDKKNARQRRPVLLRNQAALLSDDEAALIVDTLRAAFAQIRKNRNESRSS